MNRLYLLSAALLLLIAGAALFALMTATIEEEATEQLVSNEKRIVKALKQGQPVPNLMPVMEVKKTTGYSKEQLTLKDTVFYDPLEGETETFLQMTSVRRINDDFYKITLRQMVVERLHSLTTIGLSLAIVMLLLLLFLAFANRVIYRKLWAPFYTSLRALKSFSIYQSKPLQLDESKISEFSELNTAIYGLTEKTRTDFRALKEFSENASHEMQTPLAVIQAKLDELLQESGLDEQQAVRIQAAYSAGQKLSKLNQTLLLLTKIENRQFIYTEALDLREVVERQLQESEDFLQDRQLQLYYTTGAPVTAVANPALAETLVSNLLRNAIRHNIPGGEISVALAEKSLTVSNSGKPLPHAPAMLFERFRKADPSSGSLGLGLSIVRTICHLYGWQVQYEARQTTHTLRITF